MRETQPSGGRKTSENSDFPLQARGYARTRMQDDIVNRVSISFSLDGERPDRGAEERSINHPLPAFRGRF